MAKFYITNAIPYVNAHPHIGHALEFVQSDCLARFHRMRGDEVKLLCGADENALKNVQAAEKAGKSVQEFVDANSEAFFELSKKRAAIPSIIWLARNYGGFAPTLAIFTKNYIKDYTALGARCFIPKASCQRMGNVSSIPAKNPILWKRKIIFFAFQSTNIS